MKAEKVTIYIVDRYEVPDAGTLQEMLWEYDVENYVADIQEKEIDYTEEELSVSKLSKIFEGANSR